MKKKSSIIFGIIAIALALIFPNIFGNSSSNSTSTSNNTTNTSSQTTTTSNSAFKLSSLKNTSNFNNHALEHIFYGTINRSNEATGFHYEGVATEAKIIESTRTKNDKNGVYRAKVTVEGKEKKANSTFFPQDMSPQEVVDAINEAYNNKEHLSSNIYEGKSGKLTIQMYLTDENKIISAFPIYNK